MMSMAENDVAEKNTEKETSRLSSVSLQRIVLSKKLLIQLNNKGEKRNRFTWVKNRDGIYDIEGII